MSDMSLDEQAKLIGDVLRNKLNMRPAAIPEKDMAGIMRVGYVPPPVFSDITLKELGTDSIQL
jgi:hypothetical protein